MIAFVFHANIIHQTSITNAKIIFTERRAPYIPMPKGRGFTVHWGKDMWEDARGV